MCLAHVAILLLLCNFIGHAEASGHSTEASQTERETYTCENEAKRFESWASLAGRLDPDRLKTDFPNTLLLEIQVADGRTIRGVAAKGASPRENAVLVIGGNGWSAKPFLKYVLPHLTSFDADVYYFDFRGYGMSTPANPTMHAIVEDYRDIAKWLLNEGHRQLYLYAFSFGGVVAITSFPKLSPFAQVVIDSAPSRASDFGFRCSPTYETVDFVPSNCTNLTVMHGTSDWIMPRSKVRELIETARKCGATIDIDVSRGHPFQIEWESSRKQRIADVMKHFGIGERP